MQTIEVSATTLFHVAAAYLGDARQWTRLAQLNGLSDPMLPGLTTLTIPGLNSPATASGQAGS